MLRTSNSNMLLLKPWKLEQERPQDWDTRKSSSVCFSLVSCISEQPFSAPWQYYYAVFWICITCRSCFVSVCFKVAPPSTVRSVYTETLFLYRWQGVSVLKHLRVCFIILGSVTLSAPTVHEVLGGNPNACCRFIINTHLRQPYQARQEYDNSFLSFSFLFIGSFEARR